MATVLAVVGGVVYNRRTWRPRLRTDEQRADGLNSTEVATPLVTLAVVLLVFVLVQVFSSWTAPGRVETSEATATLLLFREADLLEDPSLGEAVRGEIVCYTTSVIEQDWPAMADRRISNVPTYWGARIRAAGIRQARSARFQSIGEAFVARDGERAKARQDRLGEARPTVPAALNLLMLLAVVGTLSIMGVITAAVVRPGVHLTIVIVSAVVFGFTLLLIRDFDQPYTGSPAGTRARRRSYASRSPRRRRARFRATTRACRATSGASAPRRARCAERSARGAKPLR